MRTSVGGVRYLKVKVTGTLECETKGNELKTYDRDTRKYEHLVLTKEEGKRQLCHLNH